MPVMAKAGVPIFDAGQHVRKSESVGIEHRSTQVARETEPMHPDHIDVGGAVGNTLLKDLGADVDQLKNEALNDLLVSELSVVRTFGADRGVD